MSSSEEESVILCFSCANIFSYESGDLNCPECGYKIERENYSRVISFASDAFLYGHEYRRHYEKQLRTHGKVLAKFSLPEPELTLKLIAVGALSHIIGEVSHDILRAVLETMRKKLSTGDFVSSEYLDSILDDEQKLKEFLRDMRDYCDKFPTLEADLKQSILEERIADAGAKASAKLLKDDGLDGDIHEESVRAWKKAFRTAKEHKKLSKDHFRDFWKSINN